MTTFGRACTYALLVVAVPFTLFNYYVFVDNATNHTSLNPYLLLLIDVPVAAFALGMAKRSKLCRLALILASIGAVNVFAFDALDVVKEYEAWARSGMPDRPDWSCLRQCEPWQGPTANH